MSKDKESKAKVISKDQRQKISDEAVKHLNARKYRELFGRSKDLIKYKENFNKSLEDKQSHNFKTEKYFLKLSQERLPICTFNLIQICLKREAYQSREK